MLEWLIMAMPPGDRNNQQKIIEHVRTAVDAVTKAYGELESDQAYVQTDDIEMGKPIGTLGHDLLVGEPWESPS